MQKNPFASDLRITLADQSDLSAPTAMQDLEATLGPARARRVAALMQEWGVLVDELGRDPTVAEYCRRFGVSRATAHRDLATFRDAYGEDQRTPQQVLSLLWEGLRGNFGPLLGVRVRRES